MAALRSEIEAACTPHGLTLLGVVHEANVSRALIGMTPQGWRVFQSSREAKDSQADPLDRWSLRVIPEIASALRASSVAYPFGGPPYEPFIRWAFESGETVASPVGMLVHQRAGFWISFRGALIFDQEIEQLATQNPCEACHAPCETACPVGALALGKDYDVPACKAHMASPEGKDCREGGCVVRRICPVSMSFGRDPEQSAFHMRAFLGV